MTLTNILTPLLLISTLLACDTHEEKISTSSCENEQVEVKEVKLPILKFSQVVESDNLCEDEVEFRENPFDTLYIQQKPGVIGIENFVKIVMSCPNKLDLAVTYTNYHPDVAKDNRVIGLGFSTFSTADVATCYEDVMLKLGGIPLP